MCASMPHGVEVGLLKEKLEHGAQKAIFGQSGLLFTSVETKMNATGIPSFETDVKNVRDYLDIS